RRFALAGEGAVSRGFARQVADLLRCLFGAVDQLRRLPCDLPHDIFAQPAPGDLALGVLRLAAEAFEHEVEEDAVACAQLAHLVGPLARRAAEQRRRPLRQLADTADVQAARAG